ncbi:MAG: glycosyltransferase [Bacteroidota bacterium]
MILVLFSVLLSIAALSYLRFLYKCVRDWNLANTEATEAEFPSVTIVVPARNESHHIIRTLQAIDAQNVPLDRVHVFVMDDHSDDGTPKLVLSFMESGTRLPFRLIELENSFSKKAAIHEAVEQSVADWIVTVDADVDIPDSGWISAMLQEADESVSLVCGPVLLEDTQKGIISRLASLESLGLMMIAGAQVFAGRPLFCNGANLAFRRNRFIETAGFDRSRLTGDDTDLLHLFPPASVRYCTAPASLVTTNAPATFKEFISQRQRWASKIPRVLARRILYIGLMAWIFHAGLLVVSLAAVFTPLLLWLLPGLLAVKSVMEYEVLNTSARRYGKRVNWPVILLLQPVYCISITIIGFLAVALPYRWKGRIG